MPKLHWLIEDFERDNSFSELADEVQRQGYPCEVIRYVPFASGNYSKIWPNETCVIFQGSIQLAKQIQRDRRDWIPGPIISWNNYKCSVYYAHLGAYLFNQKYIMLPFRELIRRKGELFEMFDGEFFLRPDDGAKSFTGTLVKPESLEGNSLKYLECNAEHYSLVVAAPSKLIEREWRLICAGKEVITGSRYKTFGQFDAKVDLPDEVKAYGEMILNEVLWRPDPIFSLDICSSKKGLSLLEIGAFSDAGLYKCNLEKIVTRASEIALNEWKDIMEI